MDRNVSRRAFQGMLLASTAFGQKGVFTPKRNSKPALPRMGEFVRFADALTENVVFRLTSLSSESFLPASGARFMAVRERFLLFVSNRAGTFSPFSMDLHTGTATQLATTNELRPRALELAAAGRSALFLDGKKLMEVALNTRKAREVAADVTAFSAGAANGTIAVVRQGHLERVDAPGRVWAEEAGELCLLRPDGTGCLFTRRNERELWFVAFGEGNAGNAPVLLTTETFLNACWSPDGQTVLLLREVALAQGLTTSEIHEISLAEKGAGLDTLVTKTSRFAAFAPNGDGTVYVGASRSRAQPSVVLLVRSVKRELMLCEHRASNPADVRPSFSPDSRRVFFQSDFQGKPAIYAVNVELLVEPTLS